MRRSVAPRLVALVLIIALGTYYIAVDILQVGLGRGPVRVTLELPRAAGIYDGADVTRRGVTIGKVGALSVGPDGVRATLLLHPGTRLPLSTRADVRQLSALGEQYVDLVPLASGPPWLAAGDVIPQSRTTVPVAIATTLVDLGSLLNSVNERDLATVESFFATGFVGTGPSLGRIISTGQELTRSLIAAQAGTQALIIDGNPVLATAAATNTEFAQFAAGLNSFTGQLARSDADLQRLLSTGADASTRLAALLSSTAGPLADTLRGLAAGADATARYQPQVAAMFELLPVVSGELASTISGGSVHGSLAVNGANTVCSYLPGAALPGPTQVVTTLALDNTCPFSAPDLLQRGASAAPYASQP